MAELFQNEWFTVKVIETDDQKMYGVVNMRTDVIEVKSMMLAEAVIAAKELATLLEEELATKEVVSEGNVSHIKLTH